MDTYSFERDIQLRILAILIRDVNFLHEFNDVVQPNYFSEDKFITICKLLLDYYYQYGNIPSREILESIIVDYCTKFRLKEDLKLGYLDVIHELYMLDISDVEYLKDKIKKFARIQNYKLAIAKAIDILDTVDADESEKCDNIDKVFDQAASVGITKNPGTIFSTAALSKNIIKLRDSGSYNSSNKVPTLIPTLDSCTYGGIGAGELGLLTGATGVGKSTILVNFAVAALWHGKNVYYITTELSEEDITLMCAARVSGISKHEILCGSGLYDERINKFLMCNRNLIIKAFIGHTAGIKSIKSFIHIVSSSLNTKPNLIIIDSIDYLKCDHGYDDDLHLKGHYQTLEMIEMGKYFNSGVWTSNHTTKADDVELLTRANSGGSRAKIQNCDIHLTINQTQAERDSNTARIYCDKVRRGKDKLVIPCNFNKDIQYIEEIR